MDYTTITILVVSFIMLVMFLSGKFSLGLVTMSACVVLCLTGAIDIDTAFSGLSNKLLVMIACMYVLGMAFGKTSLTNKLQDKMSLLTEKSGFILAAAIFLFAIALAQFLPGPALISLMATFIGALSDKKGTVSVSRILLPVMMLDLAWECLLPFGIGLTNSAFANSIIGGFVEESKLLAILDYFKVGIVPAVAITLYCLFIWSKIPNNQVEVSVENGGKKKESSYTKQQETLIIVVFSVVMIAMLFSSYIPINNFMYLAPAVAVVILAYTKALALSEIVSILTNPTIWMIAGMLVVSNTLGASEAGVWIGNFALSLLGNTRNGIVIMFAFAFITLIMTNFVSNTGSYLIMAPIAASVATAAGMDPRGIALVVALTSQMAFLLPTGSPTTAVTYGLAGYNAVKMFKYSLPGALIGVVALVLSANFWFPVWG